MIRIREAAELLGVSDDTVRRWIDDGSLPVGNDQAGRKTVDGAALAAFARDHASAAPKDPLSIASSARNRFAGLVTRVVDRHGDGPGGDAVRTVHRRLLMSSDAVRELGLEPGSIAVAVVKATTVIVETPGAQ